MTTHNAASVDVLPWYKERWPWIVMMGPAIVVVAATFSGWLAFRFPDALVADDYYKQGTAINQDLKRETAATSLGLQLDMNYQPQSRILSGALNSFGHPLTGAFTVTLAHATVPAKDIVLHATADEQGRFMLTMPGFEPSWWKVTVENNSHQWRLDGIWKWPTEAKIRLLADLPPAD